MTLQDFLVWIISGGGVGIIAYWLMERIGERANLSAEWKRYLSLLLAALVAVAAYGGSVAIGYEPQPETVAAWIEGVFAVIAVAVGLSQAIHGFTRLRKKVRLE